MLLASVKSKNSALKMFEMFVDISGLLLLNGS